MIKHIYRLGVAVVIIAWIGTGVYSPTAQAGPGKQPEIRFLLQGQVKSDIHIPLQKSPDSNYYLFVTAIVNGQAGRFLVDTGCSHTTITQSFARKLRLNTSRKLRVKGNVKATPRVGRIATWQMGKLMLRNFDVLVLSLPHLAQAMKIDGILGLTTLRVGIFQIDGRNGRLSLLKNAPKRKGFPLTVDAAGTMYVDCTADGKPVRFFIDSGASKSQIMGQNFPKSLRIMEKRRVKMDVNGKSNVNYRADLRIQKLTFGEVSFKNVQFMDTPTRNVLGIDVLHHVAFAVDYRNKKAYIYIPKLLPVKQPKIKIIVNKNSKAR